MLPRPDSNNIHGAFSPPLADSPWFWVLAFSLFALAGLGVLVASGWYGKRQARLELQYQARERIAERINAENNPIAAERTDDSEGRHPFATPGNNLITLWPLAVLLGAVATVAATMLYRTSRAAPGPDMANSP
jgi:hypothetical protein